MDLTRGSGEKLSVTVETMGTVVLCTPSDMVSRAWCTAREPGDEVALCWSDDRGLYEVPGIVAGWHERDRALYLDVAGEVARIQRRRDVRASVSLPGRLVWSDLEGLHESGVRTIDISASGVAAEAVVPLHLSRGEKVVLTLALPDGQFVAVGEVAGRKSNAKNAVRMMFTQLCDGDAGRLHEIVAAARSER